MPGDACGLGAENARLREAVERLRLLNEDKDAVIAGLRERVARLERLISRNSGFSELCEPSCMVGASCQVTVAVQTLAAARS